MFLLNGEPLAIDTPFTADDTQYPANWLRLSTLEEKEAIGITEVPDPEPYDQRFYWGYDADGNLIPKDHGELVEQWVAQTKQTAGSLLAPTDWYIVRQAETGVVTPPETLLYRLALRAACGGKEDQINATTTTDELVAYLTGSDYFVWPAEEVVE
jgi:hypothetical protein